MDTYIALLRGINVSGQKKIKMVALKAVFENLGFTSITTYIQSGNVVFQSTLDDVKDIKETIHKGIETNFGHDVPVLVLKTNTLFGIVKNNPFDERIKKGEIEEKKMYFTLLFSKPDSTNTRVLEEVLKGDEEFVITENAVYFFAANGYGKTKLSNNFFEKKLQCNATTRNLKTIVNLLELSSLS